MPERRQWTLHSKEVAQMTGVGNTTAHTALQNLHQITTVHEQKE
jgi:hypothetical protein